MQENIQCVYCRHRVNPERPFVTLTINGDDKQTYCAEAPVSDGLSCWQAAIEAWHRLLLFEKTVPALRLETPVAALRVRRQQ